MSFSMPIYFYWLFGEYNVHQGIFIFVMAGGSVTERDKGEDLRRLA